MKFLEVPRWEFYRDFFQITVFRYLVLWFSIVPVVANLLEGLQKPLAVEVSGQEFSVALGLPFSWQLLWLSSFMFFMAWALYQLRCPLFVKRYNTFNDYLAFGHDPRWLAWEARHVVSDPVLVTKFSERMLTKDYASELPSDHERPKQNPSVEKYQTKLYFVCKGKKLVFGMPVFKDGQKDDGAEKGIFWEIFGRFSESRRYSRIVITGLLFFSLVFFLVVLAQHIHFGLLALWSWIEPGAIYLMHLL